MLFKKIAWPGVGFFFSAAMASNYSVQLLEGIAPAGMSPTQWAAVADTMIGRTQAHVGSIP
jgi:hypothetical protein